MPDKHSFRVRIWNLLERDGVGRFPGAHGRIPNFKGAEAAELLAEQEERRQAKVVKANPDAPQLPVRARALAEGKVVYMAVPRLAEAKPFVLLDPRRLSQTPRRAASIRGAMHEGQPVSVSQVRRIDLVVCGSVVVNRLGARIGKGGGFSDLEFALLAEAGLVHNGTIIATTVHSLQILKRDLPETEHDSGWI
jgi:5-formyltetrahydrofolate cyclo-ligase